MAGRAFSLFREAGIEPILIKGPAAGIYYPKDDPRNSIDLDLAVSKTDFDRALTLSRSSAAAGLAIDAHKGLRHLDTRPWDDVFGDSQMVRMGGVDVRIPKPEDHLRILAVHWLNDGASDRDRLWDIFYIAHNRFAPLDWDAVFAPVNPKRQRWIACTIGLAHRYLQLDISLIPSKYRVTDLPDWLTKFIEKEWERKVVTRPLHTNLTDPAEFLGQLKARLRMNPVWATIHMEGSLDAPIRAHYRIGSAVSRIPASALRIFAGLFKK